MGTPTLPPHVRLMLDTLDAHAREIAAKEEHVPVVLLLDHEAHVRGVIATIYHDDDEKETCAQTIMKLLSNPELLGYVYIYEAWLRIAKSEADAVFGTRPSLHPDRVEQLVLQVGLADGREVTWAYDITPTESGRMLGARREFGREPDDPRALDPRDGQPMRFDFYGRLQQQPRGVG